MIYFGLDILTLKTKSKFILSYISNFIINFIFFKTQFLQTLPVIVDSKVIYSVNKLYIYIKKAVTQSRPNS